MAIPTGPIGSIPRSPGLLAAMRSSAEGTLDPTGLLDAQHQAVRDTIERLEEAGFSRRHRR